MRELFRSLTLRYIPCVVLVLLARFLVLASFFMSSSERAPLFYIFPRNAAARRLLYPAAAADIVCGSQLAYADLCRSLTCLSLAWRALVVQVCMIITIANTQVALLKKKPHPRNEPRVNPKGPGCELLKRGSDSTAHTCARARSIRARGLRYRVGASAQPEH